MTTEIIRDYCPFCQITVPEGALSCNLCGTNDLIPNPFFDNVDFLLEENAKEAAVFRSVEDSFLEEEKEESKLQLDQNAVNNILHSNFGLLMGLAGSGKSTLINEINRLHPDQLEIVATTGIAAVNLNSKTINSTLKYFDTKSLENAWREQLLHMNLRKVRARKKKLLIDEASMMDAEQLNLIMNAMDDINQDGTGKTLGLWLTADFLQLPPVKAKYVFHSDYWDRFDNNTIKLTKIWRQDNPIFLEALNKVRAGDGRSAVPLLKQAGVTITDKLDNYFNGTTIIPLNANVDSFNEKRLREIEGSLIRVVAKRSGKNLSEWDRLIPAELRLKVGALVMILANDIPNFTYVNGDLADIESYDSSKELFSVRLRRNNNLVKIGRICRENFSDKEPEKYNYTASFTPYLDYKTGQWVIGKINYFPLRLAWATTTHKSQGLSLDLVQIDTSPKFFGASGMSYVAMSRARTPQGLRLVGRESDIINKINTDPEVRRFI